MSYGSAVSQSDFSSGEYYSLAPVKAQDVVKFPIPLALTNRTIYGAQAYTNGLPANNWVDCTVKFWVGGSIVAEFPFAQGVSNGTGLMPRSLATVLTTGATPTDNDVQLCWSTPLGVASQYCHPFEIVLQADAVSVQINALLNITGLQIWLGVRSSL